MIYLLQAPRDLVYLLALLATPSASRRTVLVTGGHRLSQCLRSFSLENTEIIDVPVLSFRPLAFWRAYWRINALVHNLNRANDCLVGNFFSNYFDLSGFVLMCGIRCAEWRFIDHYDMQRPVSAKVSFRLRLRLWVIQRLFRVPCDYSDTPPVLTFNYSKIKATRQIPQVPPEVIKRFAKTIAAPGKSALIFDSNDEVEFGLTNYADVMRQIIGALETRGFKVFVKGHPRLGLSEAFSGTGVEIIEPMLPAELLDVSAIDLILGSHSAALAAPSLGRETISVSLAKILHYQSPEQRQKFVDHLLRLGGDKVHFPTSMAELTALVDTRP